MQTKSDENIIDYFIRLVILANQMKNCGETVTEQVVLEQVLRTLTSQFDHIVVIIDETKKLDEVRIEDLPGTMEAHE